MPTPTSAGPTASGAHHTAGTTVAVLGLGEAGSAFATDLVAAGADVRGYDPLDVATPAGVLRCHSELDAVDRADVVLSVNSASSALAVLDVAVRGVADGAVWADMNTGSPGLKTRLDERARHAGVTLADVAIMAPVPGKGLRVPLLASGDGAGRVRELLEPLGARVTIQPGAAGEAAQRKLLRSVFFKGLAASVVEALEAARAAGCEDWLRDNIAAELTEAGPDTVTRLVEGSHQHARRRADEMAAATEMLAELGVSPTIAPASRDLLLRLRDSGPSTRQGSSPGSPRHTP